MDINITEIKDSNQFLNELIDNITSAIFIVDEDPRIFSINDSFETLFYKTEDQVIKQLCGNAIGCIFHVEEGKDCGQTSNCDDCILRKNILKTYKTKKPIYKTLLVRGFYIKGTPITKYLIFTTKYVRYMDTDMVLVVVEDITEIEEQKRKLKKANEFLQNSLREKTSELVHLYGLNRSRSLENKSLIHELHHRVGNNLQIISSLLQFQILSITGKEAKENVQQTQERIEILKILYDMLLHSQTHSYVKLDLYLDSLCRYVKEKLNHTAPEINCGCDSVLLLLEQAVPLSIIMYELIQQSLSKRLTVDSDLKVNISQQGEEIEVKLSGNPELDTGEESISGLLISLLIEQLHGNIVRNRVKNFEISFPYQTVQK